MCGIAGLIRHEGLSPDDPPAVVRMTDAQAHRGPDGADYFSDRRVVLGHRRLSIIDLSAAGAQPMANEDGSVHVTYNGEIYNHQELRAELIAHGHAFRSRTDTEVLVHGYEQWGMNGLLQKLRGMFAFGVYDANLGLFLARDRVGIKPLYYYIDSDAGLLIFASEVKALLKSGCIADERDPDAIAGFLLSGSIPAPRTIVKDIASLKPGSFLVWRDGCVTTRKYWDLDFTSGAALSGSRLTEPVEELRALLDDLISRHLVSDVPVGVFLSGGVDSGVVAAFATRAMENSPVAQAFRPAVDRLTTLNVTSDDEAFNETSATRAIAAHLHTDHHEVRVTRADFNAELPKIFAAMDQPTNDGVNTWFVSKAAREAGLTVALSGLGGDEVFWGYQHYRSLAGNAGFLGRCSSPTRRALVRGGTAWGVLRGKDNWMRLAFLRDAATSREFYLLLRGFFPPQHVMRLLGIGEREMGQVVEYYFDGLHAGAGDTASASGFNYLEFKRYLHDQLLRDADVFSMAHSIEMRVPLLDHPIVEFAGSLRPGLKASNGINKPLLVRAANEPLIVKAGKAKKRGVSFPMERWLGDSGGELEEMAVSGGLLDTGVVRTMWKDFRAGRLHWSRAWALTALGAARHKTPGSASSTRCVAHASALMRLGQSTHDSASSGPRNGPLTPLRHSRCT